jgi:plasmid stabilization system protein ParE
MAWKVLITDSALADLREIVEFIAQDDPEAAERWARGWLRVH